MSTETRPELQDEVVETPLDVPVEERRERGRVWVSRALMLLVMAGLGVGAWKYGPGVYKQVMQGQEVEAIPAARLHTVRKGDLRIVVSEAGKVRTTNSTRVFPAYQGSAKITWLVREGSDVKKGDKLATFDSTQLEDVLRSRKADLEAGIRAVTIAEESLTIQRKTSESAVAQAKNAVDESQVNHRVFREMEAPKRLAELDTNINEAKTKLATAQKEMSETQGKMDAQTMIEEEQRKRLDREMADKKEAVYAWTKRVKAAELERKAYRAYTYPQMLAVKKQAAANSQIMFEKATVEARSQVLQKEQELARSKDNVTRMQSEVARLEKQVAAMTLVAPVDGFVVLGDPGQPSYVYMNQRIAVGSEWYTGNVMMTIPDPSGFEITVGIPETVRGWLKEGCEATASFDAIPGLVLKGKLKTVEKVARSGQFYEQGSNVFDGVVTLEQVDKRLVTGMSTRVEIVAEVLPNVLQVPIESVIDDGGQTVCFVKSATATATGTATGMQRRVVKAGKSNLHAVEILEGLEEGEQVDLAPDRQNGQKGSQGTQTSQAQPATKPS